MEIQATEIFNKNYEAVYDSPFRFIVNQGGARSSKSRSCAQLAIVMALKEPDIIISIVGKTLTTLKANIMRDFFTVLPTFGLSTENYHKTDKIYQFENGSIIEFFSADSAEKLKGRKAHYRIVEEANQLWEDDFVQLNMRTIKKMIFLYNPSDNASWLYDLDKEKTLIIKSTFKHNPFLEQTIIDELQALKFKDPALYTIYAEGERAVTRENIYTNWQFLDKKPDNFTKYVHAIDYGYSHPCALVKIWYDKDHIFVEEVIYESNLTAADIVKKMEQLEFKKSDLIVCETARPEITEELRRNNYYLVNADKNIIAGLNDVRSKFVYTNSKNIWKEYENYKWKKVRGQIIDEVVKENDDAMDAIRYGVRYITKYLSNTKFFGFK